MNIEMNKKWNIDQFLAARIKKKKIFLILLIYFFKKTEITFEFHFNYSQIM